MRLFNCLVACIVSAEFSVAAQTNGWTVETDTSRGTLTVSHQSLGVLLKDVRLNLKDGSKLIPASGLTVSGDSGHWTVRTATPPTGWRFEVRDNLFIAAGNSSDLVLTAEVPASERCARRRGLRPS